MILEYGTMRRGVEGMITLSQAASEKIKEMMANEGENLFLRLGVQPGGCTGFSYAMGLDDELKESDTEIMDGSGVKVVIDGDSIHLLKGLEIDYQDSGLGGGFTIHNPNAIASCGCGSSFRTATDAGKPDAEC